MIALNADQACSGPCPASARAPAHDRLLRLRPSHTARLGSPAPSGPARGMQAADESRGPRGSTYRRRVATDAIRGSGRQYAPGRCQGGGTRRRASTRRGVRARQCASLVYPLASGGARSSPQITASAARERRAVCERRRRGRSARFRARRAGLRARHRGSEQHRQLERRFASVRASPGYLVCRPR